MLTQGGSVSFGIRALALDQVLSLQFCSFHFWFLVFVVSFEFGSYCPFVLCSCSWFVHLICHLFLITKKIRFVLASVVEEYKKKRKKKRNESKKKRREIWMLAWLHSDFYSWLYFPIWFLNKSYHTLSGKLRGISWPLRKFTIVVEFISPTF